MDKIRKAKKIMKRLKELEKQGKEESDEYYNLDEELYNLLN